METLKLELKSEIKNGCAEYSDIIAYYEQHIVAETGQTDFLRVSFSRKRTVNVLLDDGSETEEHQEIPLNALIEQGSDAFRCQIPCKENVPQFWEMFWQIHNRLIPQ